MKRRAALLLEVVVALTIMTAAMGILAAQLVSGMKASAYAEQQTRVSKLVDRFLALLELDQNLQKQVFLDRQTDGDFGTENPGYFWRVAVEPTDVEGLGRVRIEILYQADEEKSEQVAGAEVVRTVALLKADPGRINLASDFGLEEEQLTQLTELQIPGLDPAKFDPQALISMDPSELMALLPTILPLLQQALGPQAGNIDPTTPEGMAALQALMEGAMGGAAGGGNGDTTGGAGGDVADQLGDLIRQRAGDGGASKGGGPQAGGQKPGGGNAGGNPGGGRGGNQGGGQRAGGGGTGTGNQADQLGDLIRQRAGQGGTGNTGGGKRGSGGGGKNPGGSGSGGNTGGGATGNKPQGSGEGGKFTIEDLMRMRDENNKKQKGGG